MTNQVFISYAHVDKDFISELTNRLKEKGFNAWVDTERLKGGVDWRQAIDTAIKTSFAVVVVITPDSCSSKYVTYEWAYALGRNLKIFPIVLKEADSEMHPRLKDLQYFDFTVRFREPWEEFILQLKDEQLKGMSAGAMEEVVRLLERGIKQREENNLANALDTFHDAMQFASQSMLDDLHYETARVHLLKEDWSQAEEHLKNAIEYNDQHIHALVELASLYRRQADKVDDEEQRDILLLRAEEKFRTALTLQKNLLDSEGESIWGSLGGVYQRRNQPDLAIDAYENATQVKRSSYPYNNLGLLYMDKGDYENMRSRFKLVEMFARKKVDVDPGDEWAYNDLLVSLLVSGKIDEAKELLSTLYIVAYDYTLGSLKKTLVRMQENGDGLTPACVAYLPELIEDVQQRIDTMQHK